MSLNSNTSYASKALLLDVISRGFSYPIADFFSDLVGGGVAQTLQRLCVEDDSPSSMSSLVEEIAAGINQITADRSREDLEAEYIALFGHNHKQEPLRLYCGLYAQADGGRVETMQRLTRVYRDYGLDLDDGAENVDHLTVVIEFLSFLHRMGDELESTGDQDGLEQIAMDINTIKKELDWVEHLDEEIVARGGHPFYLPLSRLLRVVLV